MNYTVLSPGPLWTPPSCAASAPCLDTLVSKTIGMFADLFMVGVHMEGGPGK